jgi:hypothetical protein
MLCRVAPVRTDVSEGLSASIIRVTRIGELEMLTVTSNQRTRRKVLSSLETLVLTRARQRNIPKDAFLHSHRRENLKSYKEGEKTNQQEMIIKMNTWIKGMEAYVGKLEANQGKLDAMTMDEGIPYEQVTVESTGTWKGQCGEQ